LVNLLEKGHPRITGLDEPGIGYHLGLFVPDVMGAHPLGFEESGMLLPGSRANDPNYFFSSAYRHVWQPQLRRLILDRLLGQSRDVARKRGIKAPITIIKEPAGSQVAEFIFSVLPASRLLFLVRDPRDVLDSTLDAVQGGSWLANLFGASGDLPAQARLDFLRGQAHRWLARTKAVQDAYDRLPANQRYRVRYEDLRANTTPELLSILRWLELDVDEDHVADVVERLSFEALPESARGKGKFARAATPGAWRDNLTPDEQDLIQEMLGDALAGLGYDAAPEKMDPQPR
jgi:hypothetical protein